MLLLKRRGYWLYGEDKALVFQALSEFHTAEEPLFASDHRSVVGGWPLLGPGRATCVCTGLEMTAL